MSMNKKIYVVGIGPGDISQVTPEAMAAIEKSQVIAGYTVYVNLLKENIGDKINCKKIVETPMKKEVDRCKMALDEALSNQTVSLVCSGDAGVYGMAGLMYQVALEYDKLNEVDIEVIPGITAALSGGAVLGAPLIHDFAVISLSDLLTPWELIEKRLRCAGEGDFSICIYNPSSKKRHDYLKKACEILLESRKKENACGLVKNIGRAGQEAKVMTLEQLKDTETDMFTTVFIGNSNTKIVGDKLITPRGYNIK